MSSTKSRKDTRAVVSLVARYRSPATFEYVQEACCDVSAGGMFIKSEAPASAGTLLKLECETDEANDASKIRGVGRVVWLRREPSEHGPAGMGVKFVKLEPGSKELITDLVKRLAEAGIEARSISAAPEVTQGLSGGPSQQSQPRGLSASKPASSSSSAQSRSPVPAVAQASSASPASNPTGPRSPVPHVPASFPANAPPTRSAKPDNGHAGAASNSARSQPATSSRPSTPSTSASESDGVSASPHAESHSAPAANVSAASVVTLSANAEPVAARYSAPTASQASSVIVDDLEPDHRDSVPPSAAARAGMVRVWIGIIVAVGVLLAIIFADNTPSPANTPSEAVGKTSNDHDAPNHPAVTVAAPTEPKPDQSAKPEATTNAQPEMAPNAPAASPQTEEVPAKSEPGHAAQAAAESTAVPKSAQPAAPAPAQTAKVPEGAKSAQAAMPSHDHSPPPSAATAAATSAKPNPSAPAAAPTTPQPAKSDARPYVIDFVSRPTGATVSIGDLSVVAPGQMKLGTEIPNRLKVVATRAGSEPSSAWIYRADFERVEGTLWRRVYMTLQPEGTTAPAPASPAKPQ